VIAPFSGAAAAALVIGVGWMLGWPAVQPATTQPASASQATETALNQLSSRVASLEAKVNKPAAPDAGTAPDASAARLATLEQTVASLRDQLSGLQTQSDKLADKLAGQINSDGSAAPANATSDTAAPTVDLSGINTRLDQLDRATFRCARASRSRGRLIPRSRWHRTPAC
jgi:BMFP domain-containing protein YqiC